MKTNPFFSNIGTLAVLTTCLLSALSVQAQTFNGQPNLAGMPRLEATVYALTNVPSTIKVIFNNPMGSSVRVVIRDQTGRSVYDEYETMVHYRRRFDLSSMPVGRYTVELSHRNEQFAQAFAIEPPTPATTHIALINPPFRNIPANPADGKLIVSQ